MKLKDIYRKAVEAGIANDLRGKDAVVADLEGKKKEFSELKQDDREFFDMRSLENPYADSRILFGSGEEDIKSLLVGIDIDVGEILLADKLNSKGKKIDLLFSHHPSGSAFANLHSVMYIQSDILNIFGVPINTAEVLMDKRTREVERKIMPANHMRAVDAARLLDMPFICMHTPADNMVANYLQKLFENGKPRFISDVVDLLMNIPEYRWASANNAGPKIVLGDKKRKAGRIFVDMTGGTEGAKDIFQSLTNSGVSTIVAMHMSEEHLKEAEKAHMNIVVAGHISSDNLGLNLLIDSISGGEQAFDITECSGFKRFSH